MTKKIKEGINKFKEENGNTRYTNSDLLRYIVHRLDKLPCEEHMKTIYETKNHVEQNYKTLKTWRWFAGILITLTFSMLLGLYAVMLS